MSRESEILWAGINLQWAFDKKSPPGGSTTRVLDFLMADDNESGRYGRYVSLESKISTLSRSFIF